MQLRLERRAEKSFQHRPDRSAAGALVSALVGALVKVLSFGSRIIKQRDLEPLLNRVNRATPGCNDSHAEAGCLRRKLKSVNENTIFMNTCVGVSASI